MQAMFFTCIRYSLRPPLRCATSELRGQLHHCVPIRGGKCLRSGGGVGGDDSFEVDASSWFRCDFGGVAQAVTAHPDLVVRGRQIRDDVAALIVGDDDSGEAGLEGVRLRDHPHAAFGSLRARNDAADIICVDLNVRGRRGRVRCAEARDEQRAG